MALRRPNTHSGAVPCPLPHLRVRSTEQVLPPKLGGRPRAPSLAVPTAGAARRTSPDSACRPALRRRLVGTRRGVNRPWMGTTSGPCWVPPTPTGPCQRDLPALWWPERLKSTLDRAGTLPQVIRSGSSDEALPDVLVLRDWPLEQGHQFRELLRRCALTDGSTAESSRYRTWTADRLVSELSEWQESFPLPTVDMPDWTPSSTLLPVLPVEGISPNHPASRILKEGDWLSLPEALWPEARIERHVRDCRAALPWSEEVQCKLHCTEDGAYSLAVFAACFPPAGLAPLLSIRGEFSTMHQENSRIAAELVRTIGYASKSSGALRQELLQVCKRPIPTNTEYFDAACDALPGFLAAVSYMDLAFWASQVRDLTISMVNQAHLTIASTVVDHFFSRATPDGEKEAISVQVASGAARTLDLWNRWTEQSIHA